jgi:hypothetical protein
MDIVDSPAVNIAVATETRTVVVGVRKAVMMVEGAPNWQCPATTMAAWGKKQEEG